MDFIVTGRWDAPPSSPRPLVVLRANNWDDYSFKTLFGVELHVDGEVIDLEGVKIMKRGQESGYTEIPNSFIELSDEYCSLGLEAEYYEKLMTLEPAVREDYLQSIRDAVADSSIARSFQHETAWGTSLLRFGQATNAFEVGPQILRGHPRREGVASFTFNRPESNLSIDFDFDGTAELPGRTNVIIGYNGVGKTSLLAGVANAISQVNHRVDPTAVRTELSGSDTTFGAVVTVSYSAFDDFALPKLPTPDNTTYGESRTEAFGYVYCGLRRIEPTKKRGDDTDNAHRRPRRI